MRSLSSRSRVDVDTGYDPARVHELVRRTTEAVERLALLDSTDPMAADAIRAIRLTRRNLEDHWMRALRDIESSEAMVTWRSSRLQGWRGRPLTALAALLPDHLRPDGPTPVGSLTLTDVERDELLGELGRLEREAMGGESMQGPTADELDALAARLATWVPLDADLRGRFVELSTSNLLVGGLLLRAEFPTSVVSAVISQMSSPNGPDTGVDRERYARSLSDAFAAMVDDPAACLDLLNADHGRILYDISTWDDLDPAAISDFVVAGLHTAVAVDPSRLGEGYDTLGRLTAFTTGPLGHGISAGVALGVSTSMAGYLDKLGRAVHYTGASEQVNIIDRSKGIDTSFGSYDDLRGLFGVMLRHPDAQTTLGAVTSAWAESTLVAADSLSDYERNLDSVAQFVGMLGDAADAEQAEMNMEAAAAEAHHRQLGGIIGFVVDTTAAGAGAPGPLRDALSWTVDIGTSWLGDVEPETLPGSLLGSEFRRQMDITSVAVALATPGFFQTDPAGAASPTSAQRRGVERRLAAIERSTDRTDYHHAYDDLIQFIDNEVPALRAAVHVADRSPAAEKLTGE